MFKAAVVVSGVVATCVLSAGMASADDNDTEGGRCEYGDASVNLNPSCDTNGGSGGQVNPELSRVPDIIGTLEPLEPLFP